VVALYDPGRDERDACGLGFVADASGRESRAVVEAGLEALCRVRHRGAMAADAATGDGAGLLLPIPFDVIAPGRFATPLGVAVAFHPPENPAAGRSVVERACDSEGRRVVRWRVVPINEPALGNRARNSQPLIEHAILAADADGSIDDAERRAFRARRRIELTPGAPYIASMSFRTITYKALCAADQLASFYPDLADESCRGWFALFHQRYSTNTLPTWARAQPFRLLAHNGEINTIRGNVARMQARSGQLGSQDLAPEWLLRPPIDGAGSDSAVLDETLELLVRAGRELDHAALMLVPPAWDGGRPIDDSAQAFFAYHSCVMEPWDGPAGLVFSDGRRVGAALDRNGLRPLRVGLCEDGFVACASEAGAVDLSGHGPVTRTKLGPGGCLSVYPNGPRVEREAEIVTRLSRRHPYARWFREQVGESSPGHMVQATRAQLAPRRIAAGYTKEEVTVVLRPMAVQGAEPTSSMGDDTAQPPLARHARPVWGYLKQRFAQVTNPPLDHLRERDIMSLATLLGARGALLQTPRHDASLRRYPSFLLYPSALEDLESAGARRLDATFDICDGPEGLESACRALANAAEDAVRGGARYLIVDDGSYARDRVPVPTALGAGAVHHRLLGAGLRPSCGLVVAADDARDSHHVACLLANGADAVSPRLAFETLAELAARGRLGGGVDPDGAQRLYVRAIEDGLLKIMARMGIATVASYCAAQMIEAFGLGDDVIELCFPGIRSPLGGVSLLELGADALLRHDRAVAGSASLPNPGNIKFRKGGEYHALNPEVVGSLQASVTPPADLEMEAAHRLRRAVAAGDDRAYAEFAELVNRRPPAEPRDLLEPTTRSAIPIDEVEPASAIAARFSTGAMSHGALSAEAHETLAVALNLIGGRANTGEGGEAPERYRDARNSGIKQVASGRFGVTPAYLAFAHELQIKMAQGSKPGEGGQLPGSKVSVEIARLRHTTPGVALISPPPHHDIYSIEDLAQLIFDLKQANPEAAVSVKLVASEGVGTIAAGVVKGLADVVHISGADGGTGASPLSSIKNTGLPWEVGLVEAHAALVTNGLRRRARLRVDGGMKTGRDVVVAALLGADEFSFGTAVLVAEGCILVRTCHRNTCPVGIATQDPALRAKFAGTPEMVATYLLMVATEARTLLASLGLRSIQEAVGRVDLLRVRDVDDVRARSLDLRPLLTPPAPGFERSGSRKTQPQAGGIEAGPGHFPVAGASPTGLRSALGDRLYDDATTALGRGQPARFSYAITNADRAVGTRLGCALARADDAGPRRLVRAHFRGAAGQSFGAWLSDGIELVLDGEANDYVAKGMGGGRIVIRPPQGDAGTPVLVGNTVLYGATGGQLLVAGRAGERFAVRNSGAVAVVEGVGEHACEYMTAGAVVVLGSTGRNFGAGMSGGEAYVRDPEGVLDEHLNPQLVAAYSPTDAQLESLRRVLLNFRRHTGSNLAASLLDDWKAAAATFRRVAPVAQVARIEALFEGAETAAA
jgi:glutamate synthase domain-containing protein 2/glutamate synthase domain-containing protein 1/glutamate synthase domain-containing protein 3